MKATTPPALEPLDNVAERLPAVAASLFRRKGYAGTTTRELAAKLGIQKASLYYHIDNKEEVLFDICLESLRRVKSEVVLALESAPPGTHLREAIRAHLICVLRDDDMHAVTFIELRSLSAGRRTEVTEQRASYAHLLQSIVENDQTAGRLRSDIEAKHITLALLNLLNWTVFWFDPGGDISAEKLADMLSQIFFEGAAT
jgi:AcrR family transcriptional regulator